MRFVRKFMGFTREENPALKAVAEDPALMRRWSAGFWEVQPGLYQDMALIKPPGGREKPWHQDRAYFNLTQTTRIVGVWIALDRGHSRKRLHAGGRRGTSTRPPGALHEA